jgi:hypothetical protein
MNRSNKLQKEQQQVSKQQEFNQLKLKLEPFLSLQVLTSRQPWSLNFFLNLLKYAMKSEPQFHPESQENTSRLKNLHCQKNGTIVAHN